MSDTTLRVHASAKRMAARLDDNALSIAVAVLVGEMVSRPRESRERELEIAKAAWPQLRETLRAAGRRYSSVSFDGPRLVGWCFYPVIACEGGPYKKPKSKAQALDYAMTFGVGWATVAECWLWALGGGPVVERALYQFGFGGKDKPLDPQELYPWPPKPLKIQSAARTAASAFAEKQTKGG